MWFNLTGGKVGFSSDVFVKYRIHDSNTSCKKRNVTASEIISSEIKLCNSKNLYADALRYFQELLDTSGVKVGLNYEPHIKKKIQYLESRSRLYELSTWSRLKLLPQAMKHESLLGAFVRVLGLQPYVYLKLIVSGARRHD